MSNQNTSTMERTAIPPLSSSDLLASPIYQDHLVKIYHGDSRELMPKLPRGLVVTDPPYNVGYHYEGYADNLSTEEYQDMLRAACPLPCVLIHYAEDLVALSWTLEEIPEKIVAWVYPSNTARQWRGIAWWGCKPDFTRDSQAYKNPTDKRISKRIAAGKQCRIYDWWEINQVKNIGKQKTEHPCQIPEEVMTRIIKITDCKLVIDPFCGSGTTLVAAKRLGIPAIGIDRNLNYCQIAASRVATEMALAG